jgi:hypothetical protein
VLGAAWLFLELTPGNRPLLARSTVRTHGSRPVGTHPERSLQGAGVASAGVGDVAAVIDA